MSRPRTSIAGLMGATGLVAVGFAALRNPSETWVGVVIGLAMVMPAAGGLYAWHREGRRRIDPWAGCAFACWGYLALASGVSPHLPTTALLDILRPWTEPPPARLVLRCPDDNLVLPGQGSLSYTVSGFTRWNAGWSPRPEPARFRRIGHGLIALLAGGLGGLLARRLGASRDLPGDFCILSPDALPICCPVAADAEVPEIMEAVPWPDAGSCNSRASTR